MADKPIGNMKFGIGVEGIDETINSMDKLQSKMKQAESAMRANAKAYDDGGKSMQSLSQKTKDLNTVMELEAKKIQMLEKSRDEAIKKYGAESKQVDNLNTKINQSTAKYNGYNQQLSKTNSALDKSIVTNSKYGKEIESNNKITEKQIAVTKKSGNEVDVIKAKQAGYTRNLDITNKAVKNQEAIVEKLTKEYGSNSKEVEDAKRKLTAYANASKDTEKKIDGLDKELKDTEKAMKAVGDESKDAKKETKELDGAMDSLKKTAGGVSGAVKKGFSGIGSAIKVGVKGFGILAGAVGAVGGASIVAFKELDENLDSITTATGASGKDLESLQQSFKNLTGVIPTEMENISGAIGEVNTQFGFFGDELEEATALILQFAEINGADVSESTKNANKALELFRMEASELPKVLDVISKTSQDTGVSVDQLFDAVIKGAPQLKGMGMGISEATTLLGQLEKTGIDSSSTLGYLAKASVNYAKQGKTMTKGLGETIGKIKGATTEQEKLNIASEVFGTKAASKMVEAIDSNALSMEGFQKSAANAAGTVSKTYSEILDPIDQVTLLQNRLKVSLGEVGEKVQVALLPVFDWLLDTVDKVMPYVDKAMETTGKIVGNAFNGLGDMLNNAWKEIQKYSGVVKPLIDDIKKAFSGPVKIDLFDKVKEGWAFISKNILPKVVPLVTKGIGAIIPMIKSVSKIVKEVSNYLMKELVPLLLPILQEIFDALGRVFDKITKWWDENGDRIGKAIMNLIKLLTPIFKIAIEVVKSFVKSVIGFIEGMVDVITGVVDVFSMVLTGDFTGLWDAIKRIFTGGIKAVWEWFNIMFIGKIFKGVKGLGTSVSGTIKGMWDTVKNFFTSGGSSAGALFDRFGGSIKGIANNFKNAISGTVSNMWNGVKNFFSSGANGARNIFDGFKNGISGIANTMKNAVSNTIGNLWNGIKNTFSSGIKNVSNWFADLPNQMVRAVKNGAGAITNAFKSIFNGVLRAIGGPVNGIIGGANWVLEKFGAPQVAKWNVPQYEQGTGSGGHVGGPMVVNDGGGAEMVITPDGNAMIPKGRNVMMNAPKGTHVLNEHETSAFLGKRGRVPFYKKGTGFMDGVKDMWSNTKSFVGNGINKVKETIGDIMDWVGKPLDLARNAIMGAMDLGGLSHIPLDMAKGLGSKATNAFAEKVKALFKKKEEEESAGAGGDWAPVIRKAAKYMGQSISSSQVAGLVAQIMRESGGNEKIVQSPDVVDINTLSGNPARGLLQYIPQTFDAYKVPGYGNINNGYHQLLAFFNNSNWENDLQYGKSGWGPRGHRIRGYFNGGIAKTPQIATLAENGYPEVIIPTEPSKRGRAMALLNQAKQMLGVKDERNHVGGSSESQDIALLVGLMQQQNELLQAILAKNTDIVLDGKKMNKELNAINTTNERNARRNIGLI